MSRSGYTDDIDDQWALIRWRGAVNSAIKGKRGQQFLQEMVDALDAMPEKRLIKEELHEVGEGVCAMGSIGLKRGLDMSKVDPEERESVAELFGVSPALVAEIAYENDERGGETYFRNEETPEQRWVRMRKWAVSRLSVAP